MAVKVEGAVVVSKAFSGAVLYILLRRLCACLCLRLCLRLHLVACLCVCVCLYFFQCGVWGYHVIATIAPCLAIFIFSLSLSYVSVSAFFFASYDSLFSRCFSLFTSLSPSLVSLSPLSAAVEAWSSRVVGGHSGDSRAQVARAQNEGNRGGEGGGAEAARPNVVIVVLESTTGTLVTPSNHAGVSPWATELANR